MKKTLIFSILALAAIIIATSFNLHLGPTETVPVPESMLGDVLYVCPAGNSFWQSIADGLVPFRRMILMLYLFGVIVLMFVWGWNLYQNLLQDKFVKKDFTTAWGFTKLIFWAGIILILLVYTPNHFRTVHVRGRTEPYVFCENNDLDIKVRAARATAVSR